MQQQMVNFENHLYDVLNELVDLCVNIVLNATERERKKQNKKRNFFCYNEYILEDVHYHLIFQYTSSLMVIDELVAKLFI